MKIRDILALLLRHPEFSNREISRRAICSPTTVGRLRGRITALEMTQATFNEMSDSEIKDWAYDRPAGVADLVWPDWDLVYTDLEAGYNRKEAYDRFLDRVGSGQPIADRTFREHVSRLLAAKSPTLRLLHCPGDKVMVDYAGYCPPGVIDGIPCKFQMFAGRLPASGYSFACVTRSQTIPDWLWANEAMFRYFGGVATYLVSDNLRAAVTMHRRGRPPELNRTFVKFADHFDTSLAPARPGEPKDKAAVERFVQLVQRKLRLALRNRPLLTLDQMNVLLAGIVAELNATIPRGAEESRRERFERIELPALKPLTPDAFAFFEEKLLKVPPTYLVKWDGIEYSVPHRLIASKVVVQASGRWIEIFHDGQPVARHSRRWEADEPVVNPDHMPPNHRAWRAKETDDIVLWASDYPEPVREIAAVEAARGLSGNARRQQFDLFTGLYRTYGRGSFEQACARACDVGARNIAHVRNLLMNKRHRIPANPSSSPTPPSGGNVRGAGYYAEGGHA